MKRVLNWNGAKEKVYWLQKRKIDLKREKKWIYKKWSWKNLKMINIESLTINWRGRFIDGSETFYRQKYWVGERYKFVVVVVVTDSVVAVAVVVFVDSELLYWEISGEII